MNITDVNNDCLEKVFRYLSLGDLLNVADSSKHLRAAAELTYSYKYGKKQLYIFELAIEWDQDIEIGDEINIKDWKRSYQILRCFGHLISKLDIWMLLSFVVFKKWPGKEKCRTLFEHFISYVNEYCANSLTEIKILGNMDGTWDHLKKPFRLVDKLHMGGGFEKDLLPKLFPNVRSLVFDCTWCTGFVSIDSFNFPCLENMDLIYPSHHHGVDIVSKHCGRLYSFLRSNPQLQSLTLPTIANENFLQTINECVPNLQKLSLDDQFGYILTYNRAAVHFKHVKYFEFEVFNSKPFPNIPLTFDQLEEFSLKMCTEYNEEFYTFLGRNPSIQKITLQRSISASSLVSALPMLKEIDVSYFDITIDEIHSFLSHFRYLQKLTFGFINRNPKSGWQYAKFDREIRGQKCRCAELIRVSS